MLRIAFNPTRIAMRKLLTLLIALASIAFGVCSPALAQGTIIGGGIWGGKPSGGGSNNLAVDCNSTTCPTTLASSGTTVSVTLTTTQTIDRRSDCRICLRRHADNS
jgi:hypothetical protein